MAIIVLEQIQKDIENLSEDAQYLLIDFLEILKKRYSKTESKPNLSAPKPETTEDDWSDLIGSIEAEPDLSRNYKNYLNIYFSNCSSL
ncbi:MAG: hypothetical protein VKL42_00040 [Snowella sp.]|nr:hypothetical protein [Snowella sp.]